MLVATRAHVLLRNFVVCNMDAREKKIGVACDSMERHNLVNIAIPTMITTMMALCVLVCGLNPFGGLFECQDA